MGTFDWSDGIPVLADMPLEDVVQALRDMGDEETAADLFAASTRFSSKKGVLGVEDNDPNWRQFWKRPWTHTDYTFGYIDTSGTTGNKSPLVQASSVEATEELKESRIKITLDRFYISMYPGIGTHHLLLKFFTRNQLKGRVEPVQFSRFLSVNNDDHTMFYGSPLFTGLRVGSQGITLGLSVTRVKDAHDHQFLDFLRSDIFKDGLHLLTSTQPVLGLFTTTIQNVGTYISKHKGNSKIQELELGLDFSALATRCQLAVGSYVVVQLVGQNTPSWQWDEWEYHANNALVVNKANPKRRIPYNYFVFSISKYNDV